MERGWERCHRIHPPEPCLCNNHTCMTGTTPGEHPGRNRIMDGSIRLVDDGMIFPKLNSELWSLAALSSRG